MTERPSPVTVIGWLWTVSGGAGLAGALPYSYWGIDLFGDYWPCALLRLSPVVLFLIMLVCSLLCLSFGIGILKGQDWARVLSLAYCLVCTLAAAILYWGHALFWPILVVYLPFTAILWFYLYRPEANAFFRRTEPKLNGDERNFSS
jgi:hypothetical protein